jgi:glycosyltransferase involved in cell wall biosynthesis
LIKCSTDSLLHDTAVNLTSGVHGFLFQALSDLNPTVIHFHHYVHIGMDLLHALKRWFPKAKVILTLHEYWGMCPLEGRLLKSTGQFCDGPQPDSCFQCLGNKDRIKLAVRRLRVKHFFSEVDHLISPSLFLKQRYVDWGIQPSLISVLENLPLPKGGEPHEGNKFALELSHENSPVTFAYFGQFNYWKGIDIILEAFMFVLNKYPDAHLELHGVSSEMLQSPENFHDPRLAKRCSDLIQKMPRRSVHLMNVYEPEELTSRMKSVDVVLMASRWYENAPMVIQEAFINGVMVVAPGYGGMAEKIEHKLNGLLYQNGDVSGLHQCIVWIMQNKDQLEQMKLYSFNSRLHFEDILASHLSLYHEITQS